MFGKTRAFMLRHARPLDLARWRYHFENGSREDILSALSAYQNEDGGFGHALEPDCFNPASSPLQTWMATDILREVGMDDAQHPIVTGIVRYLACGAAFDGHLWHRTVPTNDDYPHAPWWTHGPHPANEYNPKASLASFLLRFAAPQSEAYALGARIAGEAYAYFAAHAPLSDMHTAACFLQLYEDLQMAGGYDGISMDAFAGLLCAQADALIEKDTAKWATEYVCKPSQLLLRGAWLVGRCREAALDECRMIERTQEEDGAWPITWNWYAYPESWPVAKNWWRGDVAVKNMLFMRSVCGKMEVPY